MTDRRRVRARVPLTAALFALGVWSGLAACANTDKVVGEECIKSDDCLSGLCESQVCVAAPPFLSVPSANPADAALDTSPPDSAADSAPADDASDSAPTGDDGDDGGDAQPG